MTRLQSPPGADTLSMASGFHQPQGVSDDAEAAQAHGRSRDDGI